MGAGELCVKDLGFGAAADPPSSNFIAVKMAARRGWPSGLVFRLYFAPHQAQFTP
jgi:hypothetical protein